MDRWEQQATGDRIADWVAALSLGLASGFAAFALTPNLHPAAPVGGGLVALLAMTLVGLCAMRRVQDVGMKLAEFDFVDFPDGHADELLLDTVWAPDEALLLDDPVGPADPDSRVVRLFAPETIPAPGALAERIDNWLEGARGRQRPAVSASGGGHGPRSSPASAALHSALDDLRRSLR